MKKLFSKFFASLLILGVVTSCGITITSSENPTSEPPVVNKKLGLSLASKVTTDKDIIVTQNNDVSNQNNDDSKPKSSLKKSLAGETSRDDLEISEVEIPHTVIESSENSFDLAITGLASGEFSIEIKENLTDTDVTPEFSWIYRPKQHVDEMYACKLKDETASYCESIAKENYFIREEIQSETEDDTEVLIFRLFSETYDFKASDLTVTVSQEISTNEPSNARFFRNDVTGNDVTVSDRLIINSFDFIMDYDYDDSDGYTDLNNIGFGITSDLFEVKYTDNLDLDTFYDEGTVLPLSLEDENVPYEAISIIYRREGTDDEFTIINNYLVVFPHLGGIKSDEIQNPALSLYKESFLLTQEIRFFDSETFYAPDRSSMRVHRNTWTGIDREDAKLIIDGYDLPLSIRMKSPEEILFSYYTIVDPDDEVNYMDYGLYGWRIREVIELKPDLSFKLEISGVIFDLGTLYDPNPSRIDGTAGFTMNSSQQAFK